MVYDEMVDHFGDADLSQPENMLAGKRYIGKVTDIDTSASEVGNYKQFDKATKDGRTSVPIIAMKVRAIKGEDGSEFSPDANVMRNISTEYWVGPTDTIGRNMLASLVMKCAALDKDQLKSMRIQDAARQLIGAYLTFEVQIREWNGGYFQRAIKIRPASDAEKELAVA